MTAHAMAIGGNTGGGTPLGAVMAANGGAGMPVAAHMYGGGSFVQQAMPQYYVMPSGGAMPGTGGGYAPLQGGMLMQPMQALHTLTMHPVATAADGSDH